MSSQIHPAAAATEPFAGRLAGRAIVAGIIGGILVDLFLIVVHAAPFPGIYQFIASSIAGKEAFTSTSYIWLGVAIHFAVSIGWALLYTYGWYARHPSERWVLPGIAFGIVVLVVIEVIQLIAKIAQPITLQSGILVLIAHVVFFGLPVAWYLAWAGKPKGIATLGLGARDGE
jgi:hypothetical protein